ncbi:hypothetical protein ACFFX0_13190 [Citricoccus parietis]|uniref:Uncharacterized protein n=1 Tax=Citricoccus parietis TaxID=592307 RepID=A0ABV5FZI6_9MICC
MDRPLCYADSTGCRKLRGRAARRPRGAEGLTDEGTPPSGAPSSMAGWPDPCGPRPGPSWITCRWLRPSAWSQRRS